MRISEPSSLTGSGERRIKCALPPHLMQRTGRMNFCSLTTKERFSTAPPPTPTVRLMRLTKGAELGQPAGRYEKTVQNAEAEPDLYDTARAGRSEAEYGQRVGRWHCTRLQSYDILRYPADLELRSARAVSFQGWERCSAHGRIDDSPRDASRKPAEQLIRGSKRSSLKWPRNGNGSPRKPKAKKPITLFEVRNLIPVIE
jgi:hypothetical protein